MGLNPKNLLNLHYQQQLDELLTSLQQKYGVTIENGKNLHFISDEEKEKVKMYIGLVEKTLPEFMQFNATELLKWCGIYEN